MRDLERFFAETQADYLLEYSDSELLSEAQDAIDEEEFEEFIESLQFPQTV